MFDACLFFNTNTLARDLNRIWDEAFMRVGLSPSHGYLLMLVLNKPGKTQKELCEMLHLKPSTITRFVDSLAAKNLVERRQQGKESMVYATTTGKRLGPALRKTVTRLSRMLEKKTSLQETEKLVETIAGYRNKLKM